MVIAKDAMLDFAQGGLTRSPCKTCTNIDRLPACMQDCKLLAAIQQHLASTVSRSVDYSETDTFKVILPR